MDNSFAVAEAKLSTLSNKRTPNGKLSQKFIANPMTVYMSAKVVNPFIRLST